MKKYLETPEEVSRVLEKGVKYFSQKGDRVLIGTENGIYSANQKTVLGLRPRYGERTIGSLTGADIGLDLKRPERPERLGKSASSFYKGLSN